MVTTSPRLPVELIELIARHLCATGARRTLAALAQTSKRLNALTLPILYWRIVVTRRNAAQLFLGLDRWAAVRTKKQTKAEYDAFKVMFGYLWGNEGEEEERHGDGDRDGDSDQDHYSDSYLSESEVETDDELAPPHDLIATASGDADWDRRLALLAHVRHLTILQVPCSALLSDLVRATGLDQYDPDNSDADSDDGKAAALFPNLQFLCLSHRVVRRVSDFAGVTERGHVMPSPLGLLLRSGAFGAPQHVCITWTPSTLPHALFRLGPRAAKQHAHRFSRNYQYTLDSCAVTIAGYITRASSLTVHAVRHPAMRHDALNNHFPGVGLPLLNGPTLHRYFYDKRVQRNLPSSRVEAVLETLRESDDGAKFEHVHIGRNVVQDSGTMLEEDPAEKDIAQMVGWLPGYRADQQVCAQLVHQGLSPDNADRYTFTRDAAPCIVCGQTDVDIDNIGIRDMFQRTA